MRVARAFAQDPMAVAQRPFAATAWAFCELLEVEEFDELKRDATGLQAANRLAVAFHEPKRLEDERLSLVARLRDRSADGIEKARARGLAMVERIRQGRVLSDEALQHPREGSDGH